MTNATTSETTGINGYWTSSKNACEFYGITGNTIRRWAQNNKKFVYTIIQKLLVIIVKK